MNNLTFGNARFSYYETIGGGTGAGDGFIGCDGVHSHMTNTAITDPEIMETRMPVRLESFRLRHRSGGTGRFRGGDGLERTIRFLEPVEVSLLTQRRNSGPPARRGGGGAGPAGSIVPTAAAKILPRLRASHVVGRPPLCLHTWRWRVGMLLKHLRKF
jgi:5-oxoprolinase (ATP-hydrolysing)